MSYNAEKYSIYTLAREDGGGSSRLPQSDLRLEATI
jgi:hypothetical protein